MSSCRGCRAPIEWSRTASGGKIPLSDVQELGRQAEAFGLQVPAPLPAAHRYQRNLASGEAVKDPVGPWLSHFVVCPQRARFSGGGPK